MSQFIISQSASSDLSAIVDYFVVKNIEAGERLIQAFNQKCQQLVTFPNLGREYTNLRPGLRGLTLNGHIILYQTTDDGIEIVRVVNGKRDLKALFANPQEE
jgi:toxin ParE1/3/4